MEHALFIACNALALLAAFACSVALLPVAEPLERCLLTVAGMPALLLPMLIVLGSFGGLYPWPVAIAIAVAAVAAHRFALVQPARAEPAQAAQASKLTYAFAGGIIGIVVLVGWPIGETQLVGSTPPHWDDLSYHAPMAAHWLQSGRMKLTPFNYHAYYPGNGELFAAFMMLPSRHDAYASLAGLYWLTLCALAVMVLARRLGATAAGTCFGLLLLLACKPFAKDAASFAAVDLAGTASALAAIAIAIAASRDESPRAQVARLIYAGCLTGIATGTKVTYGPIAALSFLWFLAELRPKRARALRFTLWFSLAAIACGGAFYIRNIWLTGNPLFPAQLTLFKGPLDPATREQTSLLYHLRILDSKALARAFRQLLDWPRDVAYVFLAGYGLALLQVTLPGFRRDVTRRRALFVALAGLIGLAIIVPGPFSGTPNSQDAELQVRLRFFLVAAAFGVSLVSAAVDRVRAIRYLIVAGATGYVAHVINLVPAHLLWMAIFGALLALLAHRLRPTFTLKGVPTMIAVAACVLMPSGGSFAMKTKMPVQEQVLRKAGPAWNVLDEVPQGARLTWFATFDQYKYYRVFGRRLARIPIGLEPDGRPYEFLHTYWRSHHQRWWEPRPRPQRMEQLISNLRAQRIEYVFLLKRHRGPWPEQYDILNRDRHVERIARGNSHALFHLLPPEKER